MQQSSPHRRTHHRALAHGSLAQLLLVTADVLSSVFKGRNLDVVLSEGQLDAGELPAIKDLSYRTLRMCGKGEWLLATLSRHAIKSIRLKSLLLIALGRLMERPAEAHTTVNQAVDAARHIEHGRFHGLVNGILRTFLREQDALMVKLRMDETAHWQHPAWWIHELRGAYPDAWESILQAGNSHPPMGLRVNLGKTGLPEYQASLAAADLPSAALGECGLRLEKPVSVSKLPGFAAGMVSVQDIGAQRAAPYLDAGQGMRVLDACAAPGGKTAHLLERCDAEVLALEMDPGRTQRIHENLRRLGLHAEVKTADCRDVAKWWDGRPFDRILADVPCSASGVVRRHPDIKYHRRASDIATFVQVQKEILESLWPLLVPGGKMLYCTCSVFPEENIRQVEGFLRRHPDAANLPLEGAPGLQLLPNADHDGFFYALLQKHVS